VLKPFGGSSIKGWTPDASIQTSPLSIELLLKTTPVLSSSAAGQRLFGKLRKTWATRRIIQRAFIPNPLSLSSL
jgi:hypothetical protein